MSCPRCHGTGEVSQYGILDCTEPGCTAATERAALNAFVEALPPMTPYDKYFAVYQFALGRQITPPKESQ